MMDRKIWLVGLLVMPLYGDLSIGQMEVMVEKIKAKRVGTAIEKRAHFASPFAMIRKDQNKTVLENPKDTVVVFVLGGIINNKAFVNQKWIKIGDTIEGYELTQIKDNSATLTRDERIVKIFLKRSKPILQLNEGQK